MDLSHTPMNQCAHPVKSAAAGFSSTAESHGSEPQGFSPVGLLVVRIPCHVDMEQANRLKEALLPISKSLSLEVMVVDGGADAHIQTDNRALLAAMAAQVEAINRLAASNEALVQAMSEGEEEADPEPETYLDGTRR